jgi:hypothetical protein
MLLYSKITVNLNYNINKMGTGGEIPYPCPKLQAAGQFPH